MKIKYLGTAAAEGWPALFCTCEACERARKAGGRNIRSRSQSIIDGRLLIDFPADTFMHLVAADLRLDRIEHCLITHTHEDHLYPLEFCNRRQGFAYLDDKSATVLTVYGMPKVKAFVDEAIKDCATDRIHTVALNRFETVQIGDYKVTPMLANHDPNADCTIYIISDGTKTMLYAHDTGVFPEADWDYMINNNIRFDYVSLDCTGGLGAQYRDGHMGTSACLEVKTRMLAAGLCNEKTKFCLNHFSHNSRSMYDEIVGPAAEMGFMVSYDGMEAEF